MLQIPKKIVRTVRPYQYSPLRRFVEPRRFHAYCIGANKCGTHSVASMFEKNYRSAHEESHGKLINSFLDWQAGGIEAEDFRSILLDHGRYAWLEMDSSHVHIEYVDQLVDLFPQAKFILTIRDCYSWVDSFFNQVLNYEPRDYWLRLHAWRYGKMDLECLLEEKVLIDHGFHPLKNYFAAWAAHNQRALECVPSERLLIIRTTELSSSADRIAHFLEIPSSMIDIQKSHQFKAPKRHNLLAQVDADYIRVHAEEHCSKLLRQFFNDKDYLALLLNKSS